MIKKDKSMSASFDFYQLFEMLRNQGHIERLRHVVSKHIPKPSVSHDYDDAVETIVQLALAETFRDIENGTVQNKITHIIKSTFVNTLIEVRNFRRRHNKDVDIEDSENPDYNDVLDFAELLDDMVERERNPLVERAKHFDALLDAVPKRADLATLSQQLLSLSHDFRQRIAVELAPALNAHIQGMPQETVEQKKAICDFVEKALEPLGLAVKVPNTPGLPGKLKASTGHWPGRGRFNFEVYIDGKQKKPAFSDTLPELELIDATPVISPDKPAAKPETEWQEKVGPKSSPRGRKLT